MTTLSDGMTTWADIKATAMDVDYNTSDEWLDLSYLD